MRICIPTESEDGLTALVAEHLGRSPFLTLVDTVSGDVSVVPNAPHGDRSFAPAKPLAGTGVEAVVCTGAGKRAVATLQAGIRVLLTRAVPAAEVVAAAGRGGLPVLTAQEACGGRHGSRGAVQGRCRAEA
jgi:predicted Fe-Mo cluster-binding NifX family protein